MEYYVQLKNKYESELIQAKETIQRIELELSKITLNELNNLKKLYLNNPIPDKLEETFIIAVQKVIPKHEKDAVVLPVIQAKLPKNLRPESKQNGVFKKMIQKVPGVQMKIRIIKDEYGREKKDPMFWINQ